MKTPAQQQAAKGGSPSPRVEQQQNQGQQVPPKAATGSFRLLRYFALASLLVVAVIATLLTMFYAWKAEHALLAQGEQKNAAQLQLLLNHLVDSERAVLRDLVTRRSAPAADDPAVQRMNEILARSFAGTTIVKLKLFNGTGLTVFSTEAKQIGEDKSTYPGFVTARDGARASQMTRRETFQALGGTLRDVDLIGSYLPVRAAGRGVIGVVEIYDNVTQLAATIRDTRWQVMSLSVLLLSVLYVALVVIVRYADRILRAKTEALEAEVQTRARLADEVRRSLENTKALQRATEHANVVAHAARREAEAANTAKSAALYKMVETMRTPVNGAVGVIDVVLAGHLTQTQRDQIVSVRKHLLSLLYDMRDRTKSAEAA